MIIAEYALWHTGRERHRQVTGLERAGDRPSGNDAAKLHSIAA